MIEADEFRTDSKFLNLWLIIARPLVWNSLHSCDGDSDTSGGQHQTNALPVWACLLGAVDFCAGFFFDALWIKIKSTKHTLLLAEAQNRTVHDEDWVRDYSCLIKLKNCIHFICNIPWRSCREKAFANERLQHDSAEHSTNNWHFDVGIFGVEFWESSIEDISPQPFVG